MSDIFNIDLIIKKLKQYNNPNISNREKLDLLLYASKEIENEIKNLSTNGQDTYASLLRLKLASVVFEQDFESERDILWSPDKYAEYSVLRKKITDEIGNLGRIITKSQYEDALMILNKLGYS